MQKYKAWRFVIKINIYEMVNIVQRNEALFHLLKILIDPATSVAFAERITAYKTPRILDVEGFLVSHVSF